MKKIKKILIANRGEIVIRIAKTCKKLGIKTVGIYSKQDENSHHLNFVDEKVFLSNDPLNKSYLNKNKIVEICKKLKVDAVHPGYGFLSENYLFSKLLSKNNIIFIGPPPNAIKAMGDKISSKKIAMKAKVNCIPGVNEEIQSIEKATEISSSIGYPVMIKASAGGGGKGMRIAYKKEELKELLNSAKSEARNAFGDDRVFIEKYIENPRHIEIQILGDKYGNIISLGERECSIQRRHQKVIEEAPSEFLDDITRKKMSDQAVRLAKQVKYYSAGTVEFVVDKNKEFYFLEMNTRLQVEHPVTEEIFGIDLVKEMIEIAGGNKISLFLEEITPKGWAIEARLCSEDPTKDFLPSAGKITKMVLPNDIRVDAGYTEGDMVSIYYDSLLAKIISKGKNRKDAITKLSDALEIMNIKGIQTNQDFLIDILHSKEFSNSKIDTNFISNKYQSGFTGESNDSNINEIMALAALANRLKYLIEVNKNFLNISKNWVTIRKDQKSQYNLNNINEEGFYIQRGKEKFYIKLFIDPKSMINKIKINDHYYNLRVYNDEISFKVYYKGYFSDISVYRESEYQSLKNLPKSQFKQENEFLVSPMPGKVFDILVKKDDIVNIAQTLVILDAMKMENILKSENKFKVIDVLVEKGEAVAADQNLIKLEQIK
ncbi:MAG: biotin carboxylase N-terminal domain-containing protein [Pseudomonadota bacterium]|nr:biotin carboxylase N-terminal domain-containing protein [Pseudomonadota bacterium]